MAERMDLKNDVSVGMLSRFPDVLTQTAAPTNEDELWEDVRTVAEQAVDAFVAMRAVEGEKMKADVAGRLTTIETLVAKIEENSAGRVQAYSDKLYARLQELLGDRSIDEGRLVTEAANFCGQDRHRRGNRPSAQPCGAVPRDPRAGRADWPQARPF
mgnify:CR=1 FL=1